MPDTRHQFLAKFMQARWLHALLVSLALSAKPAGASEAQEPSDPVSKNERQAATQANEERPVILLAPRLEVFREAAPPPLQRYFLPDLPTGLRLAPRFGTRLLTVEPHAKLILDSTRFDQNDVSLAQIGKQQNLFEVRAATVNVDGLFGPGLRFRYAFGIDYNGFDVAPDSNWAVTDFNIGFALPRLRAVVNVGQMREEIGYEVFAPTSVMPQSERILSPFASPNNAGFKLAMLFGSRDRGRFSVGIFQDDWDDGGGQLAVGARLSGLVIDDPERRRFLHLATSMRQVETDGTIRYRARPGVAAADHFLDTGNVPAESATHVGMETHFAAGGWSLIAERVVAILDTPQVNSPKLEGFYLMGSWVITGETRPYNRERGVPTRLVPRSRWGAPELTARYARVDLNDGFVKGGRYDRLEVGVNWWATSRWKIGMLYGEIRLDRDGTIGNSRSLLTRLQWVN
jgi:phosphate-selective porin OprO/OprP